MKHLRPFSMIMIVIATLVSSLGFSGGYDSVDNSPTAKKNWMFSVISVVKNTSVTIQTANFPDNMLYEVEIGCSSCGVAAIEVDDLDSDAGGKIKKVFTIPEEFSGVERLWIRLTQVNNGTAKKVYFINQTAHGLPYRPPTPYRFPGRFNPRPPRPR